MTAPKVLIVDDERGLRITMGEFLRAEGYDVDAAEDAAEARRLLEERDHEVVVADIILPGDSGLALLAWVGETRPDTMVIMITGEPSYETAAEAVRAGAFDYLPKPLSKDVICGIVAKAARVAALERENRAYRENLEGLVRERTTELEEVNTRLQALLHAHRRAEEALRESESKYRLLAENISDVIWLAELDLRFTYVSPSCERVFGVRADEYLGRSAEEVLTPESAAAGRRALAEELEEERAAGSDPRRARILELEQYRADGSTIPVETTVTFVRDEDGAPTGVLGLSRDISKRRAAEERRRRLEDALQRAQKMEAMGRLAAGVAHDFNSLLSVTLGYATFLKEGLSPDDPLHGDAVEIEKASLRAANLTRQLLAFSRRDLFEPEPLDVDDMLSELDGRIRRIVGPAVRLELRPSGNLPRVCVDRAHLEEAIVNVVTNAREALPEGGTLRVETSLVEASGAASVGARYLASCPYVRLAFSDDGPGIPEPLLDQVFEPFFSTKPGREGAGLGLSTVYGSVTQAGGDVRVESAEGAGTTVEILLPATSPELEAARRRRIEARAAHAGRRPYNRVLVAEDDPAVLRLTCRILETAGYEVMGASCGADALRLADRHEGAIDLLLADVIMPGMSGSELADRLSQSCPGLRVLFMSGYADDVLARHGVAEQAVDVLQKPFTMEQLLAAVQEVIEEDGR